ncbi:MAG: beta-ketoacyl synthase chain length factor [Burkholderiales bacterium]|nr:beta-ketoacyl synthase chain length factor [Burkholderiales bacterium]
MTAPALHAAGGSEAGVIDVGVTGIGLLGPGLAGWPAGRALLRDPAAWLDTPTAVPAPQRLPATERRRAGALVKAAVGVADEALAMAGLAPAALATVFTSSTGDPLNCHLLCEALAAPERLVSPTRFTNSVHNAAAGYWHIAAASRAPSTSLAAYDASFGAGLLEAAVQCAATQAPVLLVACDLPYPEPLHALRPVADLFATALLLVPAGPGRGLRLWLGPGQAGTACGNAFETLRQAIPSARALPLLQALAQDAAAELCLEGAPGLALQLQVGPP